MHPDDAIVEVTARLEQTLRRQSGSDADLGQDSPSALISRDIELTTTMDILAAGEASQLPSFSYFVSTVEIPAITIYDSGNWTEMKRQVVELGAVNSTVSSAIIAVAMLHKALVYGLPFSRALSLYHAAKDAYHVLDESTDLDIIMVAVFLLCLFEFIHYDISPILRAPGPLFIKRLEAWPQPCSPLLSRVSIWMRLLRTITSRGGRTLIADSVYNLLPSHMSVNLSSPADTSTHLYELLSGPIFGFYIQLQAISAEITVLTHYHRSRSTGIDQEEVINSIATIKLRLRELWETRSATQRQPLQDLRSNLAPKVAEPIISLVGVCAAAYHAEFIEMGRVLGDPVRENTDSKQAMCQVRELVESAYSGFKLNAGYLRPLFLYAIECMDREETLWAVEMLQQINDPVSRSGFFAAFAGELSDAQLRKKRRVTSKYFCIWYFGVPPPYL